MQQNKCDVLTAMVFNFCWVLRCPTMFMIWSLQWRTILQHWRSWTTVQREPLHRCDSIIHLARQSRLASQGPRLATGHDVAAKAARGKAAYNLVIIITAYDTAIIHSKHQWGGIWKEKQKRQMKAYSSLIGMTMKSLENRSTCLVQRLTCEWRLCCTLMHTT